MKRILLSICLILGLAGKAGNLIRNGNFEEGLQTWRCAQQKDSAILLHSLSAETKSGMNCLRITGDPGNPSNAWVSLSQELPVLQEGIEYRLSFQMRCSVPNPNNKRLDIVIRPYDAEGRLQKVIRYEANILSDLWTYCEMVFIPSKNHVKHVLLITSSNFTSEDAAYMDELDLRQAIPPGAPFDPEARISITNPQTMDAAGIEAQIDRETNLLASLKLDHRDILPAARNASVIFVQKNDQEYILDGKENRHPVLPFKARSNYRVVDGNLRETVEIEALQDAEGPFKLGVRHGFDQKAWKEMICALSPVRVLPADKATTFSFRTAPDSLNPSMLELYQSVIYPLLILSDDQHYLWIASRNFDDPVTLTPNSPMGYAPVWQRAPLHIKAGEIFRFETNWRLFDRKQYMLRDVWRYQIDHLQTSDPQLKEYLPPRYPEPRSFGKGPFGSVTYFVPEREQRLFPQSSIWYSWHDMINERYPTSGEWWSNGNLWKGKLKATEVKSNVTSLMQSGFKPILYIRVFANLHQRGSKFPAEWTKLDAGGGLQMYGGGYQFKLPPHVAAETGYDAITWGTLNPGIPECGNFLLKEFFDMMDYYRPYGIGWDCMGGDPNDFLLLARVYDRIRKEGRNIKVSGNECNAHSSTYMDQILIENGILGGKTAYDFEIARAYNITLVCLERFNLFQAAVKNNLHGTPTWLYEAGLAANKRYLDVLLKRRPELAEDIPAAAQLCQLRGCLYDLSLGASPGYLEEAKPVPQAMVEFSSDINGILKVNRSFALKLPNGQDVEGFLAASAWTDKDSPCRIAAFNDGENSALVHLRLDKTIFAALGWSLADFARARALYVTPEGEKAVSCTWSEESADFVLNSELPGFTALLIFADRQPQPEAKAK